MHDAVIVVHTVAGVLGFITGVMLVKRPGRGRGRPMATHLGSLGVLAVTAATAISWDWPDLEIGARVAFTALIVLAVVMVLRADRARRAERRRGPGWRVEFVEHVGFSLISLFNGFVIVTALTLGGPPWLVAVAGISAVIIGRRAVHRATSVAL